VTPAAAFYCVCDERYFLGAVGMINSLRLLGHEEPVYVLDCGLSAEQRRLLGSEATIVEADTDTPPWLLKSVAPLRHPAAVMVLIDADLIAVRNLAPVIDRAAAGEVVAFRNDVDRFVPEWGELLDLGEVRRRPYLSSALVAMPRSPGEEILRLMESRAERVDFARTFWRANAPDYPFLYADQDVLNAILASRIEPEGIAALDHRLAATTPFGGLERADELSLRSRYPDGTEPYVVHAILPSKPWLEPMYHGVYSQLLMRLLTGPGVAITVPPRQLPVRFRKGTLGHLARLRIHARDRLGWRVRNLLPRSWTERLDRARSRRAAT
jgi:hypothetical protein